MQATRTKAFNNANRRECKSRVGLADTYLCKPTYAHRLPKTLRFGKYKPSHDTQEWPELIATYLYNKFTNSGPDAEAQQIMQQLVAEE